MGKIYISKLDAAFRQLTTGVNLFMRYGDPVSIHTLGCAAQEILESLGKPQNIKSFKGGRTYEISAPRLVLSVYHVVL